MKALLRWGVSLGLLAGALSLLDWRSLVAAAASLSVWAFVAAVALACAQFLPLLARWRALAGVQSGWYACAARYFHANLFNAVSPGNLGGDVYRFFAFRTPAQGKLALVLVLVRERILGLSSMLIGLLTGLLAMQWAGFQPGRSVWRAFELGSVVALSALLAAPLAAERLLRDPWRSRVREAFDSGRVRPNAVLMGWSLLALAFWYGTVQFIAARLGADVPWCVLLAIVTCAELIRIVPLTVQGLGLREGAYAALFAVSGFAPETGFVVGAAAYLALSAALVLTGALGAAMLALEDGWRRV